MSAAAPASASASASASARTGYLAILALPGALRVFLPAMLGRLSFAMVSLALLLLIQSASGSFAAAGIATGAFGLANVLASPMRARLVDARGQRPVLVALALGHAAGLVALVAAVRADAPAAVIVVVAATAGLLLPPLGAAMRVVWAALVPDVRMRTRAYSLDAVGEEIVFTVGPLVVGTLGMTSSPLSRAQGPRADPEHARTRTRARASDPLRQPLVVPLLVTLVGVGAVLALVALRVPDAPGPLALVAVAVLLVPVGLFLAPAMATGYLLADEQTAAEVRTEASAWVNTAVNTGVALAAAGVGAVVDAAGPVPGIVAGAVAALVVAGIAAPSLLRRRAPAEQT